MLSLSGFRHFITETQWFFGLSFGYCNFIQYTNYRLETTTILRKTRSTKINTPSAFCVLFLTRFHLHLQCMMFLLSVDPMYPYESQLVWIYRCSSKTCITIQLHILLQKLQVIDTLNTNKYLHLLHTYIPANIRYKSSFTISNSSDLFWNKVYIVINILSYD